VTLVLYYHELSEDDSPLCVSPSLFSEHLAVLAECRANVLTAAELADALDRDSVPARTVVLTFDDGFAASVREARPRLEEARMRATFYCVAGHLGGENDWPTQPPGVVSRPLASVDELRELVRDGHEIGSHGWTHAPLDGPADLEREIVASRSELESTLGTKVRTFAYPYGASPTSEARALVAQTYVAAFGTTIGRVRGDSPRQELPRVDAHYLRDPRLLRRVVTGSLDVYLGARRIGSRTRRAFRKDYVPQATS
jgi:peptidoglycan/xylan/chitin deacetylase (PgdA/CDA1 family)